MSHSYNTGFFFFCFPKNIPIQSAAVALFREGEMAQNNSFVGVSKNTESLPIQHHSSYGHNTVRIHQGSVAGESLSPTRTHTLGPGLARWIMATAGTVCGGGGIRGAGGGQADTSSATTMSAAAADATSSSEAFPLYHKATPGPGVLEERWLAD